MIPQRGDSRSTIAATNNATNNNEVATKLTQKQNKRIACSPRNSSSNIFIIPNTYSFQMQNFRYESVLEQRREFCGSKLIKEGDVFTVEREYTKFKVLHNKYPVGYLDQATTEKLLGMIKKGVFVQLRCSKIDSDIHIVVAGHPVCDDIDYDEVNE